jgi:hydroxymethylbilane synthase
MKRPARGRGETPTVMTPPLRIGTRGSRLALWQANYVADRLRPLAAPRVVELVAIQTAGDQAVSAPLTQIGGEGVFTKEIQNALVTGAVDLAVHSLKDLPTVVVPGLVLGAVPARGPTGDVLVSSRHPSFDRLPFGALLATSSLRRRAQVWYRRPDLRLVDIRGNVPTRLGKLEGGGLDALILAEAGLERLGLAERITERLDPAWMLPAVGQGALGLECREEDTATRALLESLNDAPTRQAVLAERAFLRELGGGCQVPIGAWAYVEGKPLRLRGVVLRPDGGCRLEGELTGSPAAPEELGYQLARVLLGRGARQLLTESGRGSST